MATDTTRETILTYEGIAEYYASIEDDPALRESIRGLLGPAAPDRRVLEIGCGPGRDAAVLRAQGFEVTAIDLCHAFIERGRIRFPEVDFRIMDFRNPEFAAKTFDGILGMAALVHVLPDELAAVILRYRRLLRPGGRLVLWMSDSPRVPFYDVPDWGGASTRSLRMWCHDRTAVVKAMADAGFQTRILQTDSSYYATMKRVREHEVSLYTVVGRIPPEQGDSRG